MDDCMLDIMEIEASFMSTFTDIRRMNSANMFGTVEVGLQAQVRKTLQTIWERLHQLKSASLFKNADVLLDYMIMCLRSLDSVIRGIHVEYTNKATKHKAETLISSYHDEFIHLVSNLKRICEMHAVRTTNTKNMKRVVDLLSIIVDKLEITSDSGEDPARPPAGPGSN
jgi:hypothetical protein